MHGLIKNLRSWRDGSSYEHTPLLQKMNLRTIDSEAKGRDETAGVGLSPKWGMRENSGMG